MESSPPAIVLSKKEMETLKKRPTSPRFIYIYSTVHIFPTGGRGGGGFYLVYKPRFMFAHFNPSCLTLTVLAAVLGLEMFSSFKSEENVKYLKCAYFYFDDFF